MEEKLTSERYAAQLATQLRKGFLAYCVLMICSEKMYTSDIIRRLQAAELVVVEGTIYPLLSRLKNDGLLAYEWQESEQGPPRKYYQVTPFGVAVKNELTHHIEALNAALKKL
ncbi:MAG TPA: PadR family transcriptional regulator [Verrucomicrobiae bacterium]|nr:PadR family transcriptional regulator [Verrucomicrobiae bacterium]